MQLAVGSMKFQGPVLKKKENSIKSVLIILKWK